MKKSSAHGCRLFALDADGHEKRIKAESLRVELSDGRSLHLLFDADQMQVQVLAQKIDDLPASQLTLHPISPQALALALEPTARSQDTGPDTLDLTAKRDLTVQYIVKPKGTPSKKNLRHWVNAALMDGLDALITLRVVDEAEMQDLNHQFCNKPYATNVLSFPYDETLAGTGLAGDIVLCAPVIAAEAKAQDKPLLAHWAHLVVHGTLHLQGHDHEDETEAEAMENLETALLQTLGFADPYASEKADASSPPEA